MSSRQNIEIDYCPQCRGVWLDRGELDKLIERSVQEPGVAQAAAPAAATAAPPPQGRPYRDDDHGRYHGSHDRGYRKKSFWHEIFD
jgi:Zn-finger nucleic acid-binding protein